ncbi:ABC transporter permease [Clostridium thermarum]|uniref:ABC transporter permease n=1 Tax=Clostridium thermarum TaxID=1716543 RepID=UPI00111D9744|nr:ABC transporter permease [Clostridium thermarum]
MATFKAYFKKEILESKRQFRYLIVFLAFAFLALSNPIVLKLMPKILESSGMSGMEGLLSALPSDKTSVMQGVISDFFQTGILVMVFTFCNILSEELRSEKFVLPFSKGADAKYIVLAKVLHYSLLILAAVCLGLFLNYYYVGLMFDKGISPPISGVLFSALLISLFFIYNFMLTMFFSLIFKKGILAGIVVAAIQYFSVLPSKIEAIEDFIPYNLLVSAGNFTVSNMTFPIIIVIIYIVALAILNSIILKKKEII